MSIQNHNSNEVYLCFYFKTGATSLALCDEILNLWEQKHAKIHSEASLIKAELSRFISENIYNSKTLRLESRAVNMFARISIRASSKYNYDGAINFYISPTLKQNSYELMNAVLPFFVGVCGLEYLHSGGISFPDITVKAMCRSRKTHIVDLVQYPGKNPSCSCFYELTPNSEIFSIRDRILSNESLLINTLAYLSCNPWEMLVRGWLRRPWD